MSDLKISRICILRFRSWQVTQIPQGSIDRGHTIILHQKNLRINQIDTIISDGIFVASF